MATGATPRQILVRRRRLRRLGVWLGLPALLLASAALLFRQLEQTTAPRLAGYADGPPPTALATAILTFDNVRHLRKLADFSAFELDKVLAGAAPVPRLYFASLPSDLAQLGDFAQRRSTFLKAALPLVLLINENVMKDRRRLLALRDEHAAGFNLHREDQAWLADLAQRYKLRAVDFDELVRRVDAISPSLALGQAATETGWGTSRPARRGNALFGQMIMANQPGDDGTPVPTLVVQSFDDLYNSVRAYAENLNTHPAYAEFRRLRAQLRETGDTPDGYRLIGTLLQYSERGADYVTDVRTMIRSNDLGRLDGAVLDSAGRAQLVVPAT
jgi:Bax protein